MSYKHKIKALDDVASSLKPLAVEQKKVVHCHGVFDLLHIGHIRHLEQAKQFGDLLIVTLTPDHHVNKGPNRPAFAEQLRAEAVAALDCVDYVAINKWPTAVETIRLLKPDVYVKGLEYKDSNNDITGKIKEETEAIRSVNGKIQFTEDITFSSSRLINQLLPTFDDETNRYLEGFRKKFTQDEVLEYLRGLRKLKVGVIGETIIDEYVYCNSLGKSGKESMLVMKYLSRERYPGGVLALANHMAGFCDSITLLSYLGSENTEKGFVKRNLKANIDPVFIEKSESPTIVKKRFLDSYSLSKLFGVYEINDEQLNSEEEKSLCKEIKKRLSDCDVVIIADYDHGLITPKVADLLENTSSYLAINTQINAANIGFHAISKYNHADYVCVQEGELRLDRRSKRGDLEDLILDLADRLDCPSIMVTRGSNGSLLYHQDSSFDYCPAFALNVVDRVGAGDAVLALTSLMAATGVPAAIINFVGNIVGANAVTIIGNKSAIDRTVLFKGITSLLK